MLIILLQTLSLPSSDGQILAIGTRRGTGGGPVSAAALGFNLGLVIDSIVNSVSQLKWKGYVSAWGKWRCFCSIYKYSCSSEDPAVPIALVCFLLEDGLSISSVRKVLAGVSFFLRVGGFPPFSGRPVVRQMLKSLKRSVFVA